jgi:hypothetical protein
MPDHDTPNPLSGFEQAEATILTLLFDQDHQQPWSIDELIREVGRADDTRDAIASLHGSGLLHRIDDFVFTTRAARRLDQIDL